MDMKIVGGVVGIFIAILMIGSIVAPIVTDAAAESDTYVNVGYYDMSKYTADDELSISWDYSNPDILVVNGESVTVPYPDTTRDYSIVLSTNSNVRMSITHNALSFYGGGTYVNATVDNPTFTLTYSGGTISATNGNTSKSVANVTEVFCISDSGDYVMKKANKSAYVLADSEIFASGRTYISGQQVIFSIWGTFDNNEYSELTGNWSVSDFTKISTEVSTHVNLYSLEKFTFTCTYGDTSVDVIYDTFIVPKEVTADRTDPLDRGAATLLVAIIPILILCGVMLAVSLIRRY